MSVNLSFVLKSRSSKCHFSEVIPGESGEALGAQSLTINVL